MLQSLSQKSWESAGVISILTGQDHAQLLARLSPKKISDEWQKSMSVDVGDAFRRLNSIEYWMCPKTKFCWYTPKEAAGGGEVYAQLQKFDWYYMPDKWEFNIALSLLPRGCSVLEVGVGVGHFLQLLKSKGYPVQGVELNPQGAFLARSRGFQVHEVFLRDLATQTGAYFDAICSFQVLEHIPDPIIFLYDMIALLKPGGKLILSVPNAAVMRNIDPHNIDLLNQPPHHMGHWDENVFHALEHILPVKVISVHREPLASHHVVWMVRSYLRAKLSPLGNTISRLLINRYTTAPIQWLMYAGMRKLFPGHTLLVELEYLPS